MSTTTLNNAISPLERLPRRRSEAKIAYAGGGAEKGNATLLFIHGLGLSCDCWRAQLAFFEQKYRAYAIDLPGHGDSAPLAKEKPKLADFARKINDFKMSEIGGGQVVVIGHSLGALIALTLAAAAPQHFAGVAALSAVYRRPPAAQQAVLARARQLASPKNTPEMREQQADDTLLRWFGNIDSAPPAEGFAAASCRQWLLQTETAGYAAAYRVFAESDASRIALSETHQPMLFLTGARDKNSTANMTRQLADAHENAKAVVLNGHAHMLQMTAADEVNKTLATWLHDNSFGPKIKQTKQAE